MKNRRTISVDQRRLAVKSFRLDAWSSEDVTGLSQASGKMTKEYGVAPALTLTLSPGEREQQSGDTEFSEVCLQVAAG
jgi:hypothetical protein